MKTLSENSNPSTTDEGVARIWFNGSEIREQIERLCDENIGESKTD